MRASKYQPHQGKKEVERRRLRPLKEKSKREPSAVGKK